MVKLLQRIHAEDCGASAAEYALMIALVGGLIIIGATSISTGISGVFTKMAVNVLASGNNIQTP